MKLLQYISVVLFILYPPGTRGQHNLPGNEHGDTTSLLHAFKKGKTEGHFRLFYMTTGNDGPLTDYYALAFGGGLKYQTKNFRGFQLGVGGFFIWNLASSDLTQPDLLTNVMNRYEIGQFDQEDPANKKNMQRLEDFFIRYNFKNSFLRYGKQVIKTPFINPQDGRMRPTGEQGVWAEINEMKKTRIELGWLTHISPRGTVKWYRGASSAGIYPSGAAISGIQSEYKNNLASKGIAVAGITYKPNNKVKLQAWDHWVENVFHTVLLQADGELQAGKNKKLLAAVQYIHQQAVHNGGNADPVKTYFDPSQQVNILGARIAYGVKESVIRLNYSRITKAGRFLFPREWGREPLFTFLSRERNEGLGDVHAFTINLLQNFFKQKLSAELSAGYYDLPDVKNTRLNKYGFPSYSQVNFSLKYSFDGFMKGLNTELLYLYKKRNGNIYSDRKYVINKVELQQLNFIFNYIF
jgi:hypothetical protein